ncbi:MAG TPA: hypothetical protein VD971_08200 [Phycisphaerales bacterium]|nr:hypothetical protein [Phycisphaerales bacterium]
MLDGIRDSMARKPWIGWTVAGVLLVLAVALWVTRRSGESPYSPERMQEELTVRFTDTDEVVKIPRGDLDRELRRRGDRVDPSQGIINPKTGKATGFLVDEDEWTSMVDRINKQKAAIRASTGNAGSPVAPASATPPK